MAENIRRFYGAAVHFKIALLSDFEISILGDADDNKLPKDIHCELDSLLHGNQFNVTYTVKGVVPVNPKPYNVYLFISQHRIVGCLVAEPIEEAFKVVPWSIAGHSNSARKKEIKLKK
ncbi:hypothetical protein Lal_00010965 [Lupinus albus]|nr:hypothetical protein Lal_00010965 [Lupinus albus]